MTIASVLLQKSNQIKAWDKNLLLYQRKVTDTNTLTRAECNTNNKVLLMKQNDDWVSVIQPFMITFFTV